MTFYMHYTTEYQNKCTQKSRRCTCFCVCSGIVCSDHSESARVLQMSNCMESNAAEKAKFHDASSSPVQQRIWPT